VAACWSDSPSRSDGEDSRPPLPFRGIPGAERMGDRAVQPEAPIFEVTEEQAKEIVDEWVRLYGTRHPDGSISFPRAASQERPQPDEWLRGVQACIDHGHYLTIEDVGVAQERPQPPLHGHQYGGDWVECTDEHPGVAQERPHPCADCAEDAFTGSGRGICAYHEAAAQERPSTETTPIDVQRDD
jgi:hypothetical protein